MGLIGWNSRNSKRVGEGEATEKKKKQFRKKGNDDD